MQTLNLIVLFVLMLSAVFITHCVKIDKKNYTLFAIDLVALIICMTVVFIGIAWLVTKII